ncbi:MAG: sulfatase [Myxococcales bacterium]|nr:sulfatase [Myxococcales bacterium]
MRSCSALLTLLLAAPALGCGSATLSPADAPLAASPAAPPGDEPPQGAGGVAGEAPLPLTPAVPADAPAAAGAPRGGPELRVHYALAAHPERAELRQGGALHVDLGELGGEKYTRGGWATRWERVELEGVQAVSAPRGWGLLWLPGDPRAARLHLRIRPQRRAGGQLLVRIGDRALDRVALAPGRFSVISLELGELPTSGEELRVRLEVPGGFALDWLRLGGEPPPEPERAGPGPALGDGSALAPGEGWSLGYALEIPEAARLLGLLRRGRLSVSALRDGAPALPLAELDASEGPLPIDLSLSALAGEVARLDLRFDGDALLEGPAIVRPARAPVEPFAAGARARNVLIYLVDTLRADKLSIYEPGTRVQTPGLEAFARTATVMLGARSQECWTKPSVATLLTGLMPWEHTATGDGSALPRSARTLAELLSEAGFHTGGLVANGYVSDRFGFGRGWGSYRNYIREGRPSHAEHVASDALAWLDSRPADQPFFLYVHAIDPHVPYRPRGRFAELYVDPGYRGPLSPGRTHLQLEAIKTGRMRLDASDRAYLEGLYDGEIAYHDMHLQAVMAGLEERGLAEETIVVFTSDHGEEFWDHGSVGHGHSVHEELVRIPLVLRVPGASPRAGRLPEAVGLVDVLPTILEALGQPIPADVSGHSLLPALRGEASSAPSSAVSGFMDNWRALTIEGVKLIERANGEVALYDLRDDPHEGSDRAGERPLTLRYLRGLLGLRLATTRRDAPRSRGRELGRSAPRGGAPSSPAREAHAPETVEIDPEVEAQLRALGYVGDARPR